MAQDQEYAELDRKVNNCMWRWETCMRRAMQARTLDDRYYWIRVAERFLSIMEGHVRKMRELTSMPELDRELAKANITTE